MNDIDVIITSTSRPQFLKPFLESIQKHLFYSGNLRWHIHEGATNWDGSWKQFKETKKYIQNVGLFDSIQITNPNTNKAEAMMKLKDKARSDYVLYFEDDHVFFKDVYLDKIIDVMNKYPQINQVSFNKPTLVGDTRKIPKPNKEKGWTHFTYESRWFDDLEMVVADRWHWIASVWRNSFIKPKWEFKGGYSTKKFNHKLKGSDPNRQDKEREWDSEWLEKIIGAYILMPTYCKHMSWKQRTKRNLL